MVGISSVIGEKGQVTIPKPIRSAFRLLPGDEVLFDEKSGEIVMRKNQKADALALLLDFRAKYGAPFTKSEFRKVDWDSLYDEELSERNKP